ncbi:histidine phosphatase family protein [Atopobium fossor]|uniref:histidine phosphatase family protein n=1 Tax=Atopobium fossor TaxID=39487 RepID=UPI00040993E5|nr:histidine phosphatase family protein [Atopobium fossor]
MSQASTSPHHPTSKTVTFYYLRHGKTEFNRDLIIQGGRVDSPLANEYLYLIHDTTEALKNVQFNACWCSPLKRAQDTARMVLGNRKIQLQPTEDLREFDFGSIDGKPFKNNRFNFISSYLMQDFSRFGGEKRNDVCRRIRRIFEHMYTHASDGDKILVAAHGALVRYLVWEFMDGSACTRSWKSHTVKTPNASIGLIKAQNGRFTLLTTPLCAQELKQRFSEYLH